MAATGGAIKAEKISRAQSRVACEPRGRKMRDPRPVPQRLCRTGTTFGPPQQRGAPDVKRRSELTKKATELTIAPANNGAGVLAVFTASLRSLLIALV